MGKHLQQHIIVLCILMLCLCTVVPQHANAGDITVSLRMLQGEQQTRFDRPVLVAGIWHYVNVSINQIIDEVTVRLYKGNTPSITEKNETNYYEWSFERNSGTIWNDVSGYDIEYIKQDSCAYNTTMYSFCIGIKDAMPNIVDYYENWTLDVVHAGSSVYSEDVVVEKPKTGVSVSKPSSINFYVDPFTVMDAQGDNFFKIGNIGNIPLSVTFDTDTYRDIEFTDVNTTIDPADIATQYVIVHSESWPPGIKKIDMQLNGSYPQTYFVDTDATVTLYSSFVIDVPQLVIYVGHSNYQIDEIQGTTITFQYVEKLNMNEGEVRDITAYVSGNGTVTVDVSADGKNISLLKLLDGATETHSPLSFTSTNSSERVIIATIKALGEGKTGVLTYTVTSNGVTKIYTTRITIGPPISITAETSSPQDSIPQIVVILIVVIVVLYMVFSYIRSKKR